MTGRKCGGGISLRAKLALMPLLAAMAAVTLWLPTPAQAQEATADCGAGAPLNGRTQKVVDEILSELTETDCSAVTSANLATISTLNLDNESLSSLLDGDFSGLSSLQTLNLGNNSLTALPEDVFDGLSSLQTLRLNGNSTLAWLPPDVFDGLSSLEELYLNGVSSLACVHAGQFNGLSELTLLRLANTNLGNISPGHFSGWSLDKLEKLHFGADLISTTSIGFQQYKDVLPALVEAETHVRSADIRLSSPICGFIEADIDDNNFHTTVRVRLEESLVRPNRGRASDAAMLGDGFCGSDASETQHTLWTWQTSSDGLTWADMASDRQPNGYGVRAEGECSFTYTPQSGDHDMYVRAYVPVDTIGVGENRYRTPAFGPLNVQ